MQKEESLKMISSQVVSVTVKPAASSNDVLGEDNKSAFSCSTKRVSKKTPLDYYQQKKIKYLESEIQKLTQRNKSYNDLVNELKNFQEEHCQAHASLLNGFYTQKQFNLIYEKNGYNERIELEFLALMRHLVTLKNALPQDRNSLFYHVSRDVLLHSIVLAQDIMNSNEQCSLGLKFSAELSRKEKIISLTAAIQMSTEYIQNPGGQFNSYVLITATDKMRRAVEGPDIFQNEHRLRCGLVGALGMLYALSLFVVNAIFISVSIVLPVLVIPFLCLMAMQIPLFSISINMLNHALRPDKSCSLARRLEIQSSCDTADAMKHLAHSNFTVFSKRGNGVSSGVVSSEQICSLTKHPFAARNAIYRRRVGA